MEGKLSKVTSAQIDKIVSETLTRHAEWAPFYAEVLGVNGTVRALLPSLSDQTAFAATEEYRYLQQCIAILRSKSGDSTESEPTHVITVRLPKCMHDMLRSEAHQHQISMNQLCITKLLQSVGPVVVPHA